MERWKKYLIIFLGIFVPVFLGLYIRYKPIKFWYEHKSAYFVNEKPIFTGYDAFYYARLAEEYKKGTFKAGGVDPLRFYPDKVHYPSIIPLISWLFAKLSQIFNKSIEELSLWVIPILAVLPVIPIFLFFWKLDLPLAGFGGALVLSTSYFYLVRTSIGRIDTDSLIVFFQFAIPLTILLAPQSKKRIIWLLIGGVLANLFYWWYLHSSLILVLYLFALMYIYLEDREQLLKKFLLLTLFFNPVVLASGFLEITEKVHTYIVNFGKPLETGFPNVQVSIAELQKYSLDRLAASSIGNKYLFIAGLLGILLFLISKWRVSILLIPTFLIGFLTFFGANRFLIFLAPFIGIGLGYALDILWKNLRRFVNDRLYTSYTLLGFLLLLLGALYSNNASFNFIPRPVLPPAIAQAFIKLKNITPKNAVIWTWWDYGYAIQYYAGRATYHDGGSQFSPKTYFVALSFTTADFDKMKNIINSVSICGAECIEELIKSGKKPEDIKLLFENGKLTGGKFSQRPVYVLFTGDLINKFYWISYFGTWDFEKKRGTHLTVSMLGCKPISRFKLACTGNVNIDFRKGFVIFNAQKKEIPLMAYVLRTKNDKRTYVIPGRSEGLILENVYTFVPKNSLYFLINKQTYNAIFNRLFILREYPQNFSLVDEKFPFYVLYGAKNVDKKN